MNMHKLVFLLVIMCQQSSPLTESEMNMLPPLYEMDDYQVCKISNDLYCRFNFKVYSNRVGDVIWQIMERTKLNPAAYNRDVFHRYRCIPKDLLGKNSSIVEIITQRENELLKNKSVVTRLVDMECKTFGEPTLSDNESAFLYIASCYLALIILSTLYDIGLDQFNQHDIRKANNYLLCFSIRKNWKKFLRPVEHPDYERLKVFQGLKVLCMMAVVGAHTTICLLNVFTKNPEFYEALLGHDVFKYCLNLGLHFVQIFFLMSAWLLANGLFPLYFEKKKVTNSNFWVMILVRYGRLIAPLALVVFFGKTTLYRYFQKGPQGKLIGLNYEMCRTNGWATLFLVNSYFNLENQCHLIAWYVSADFQLFLGTITLLHITKDFKFSQKHFLTMLYWIIGISWIVNILRIYINRFGVTLGVTPEKSTPEHVFAYENFVIYSSPFSNVGGYCVGLIAGAFYNAIKYSKHQLSKWVSRSGLAASLLIIYVSTFEYKPFVKAIIGASMKPAFNAGIACFLLGMIFSKETDTLKRILEWKYFQFVAKLLYSIYISHYWISFGRELMFDTIIEMTYFKLVTAYILDMMASLVLGLVVFLLLESPSRGLISLLLSNNSKGVNKKD